MVSLKIASHCALLELVFARLPTGQDDFLGLHHSPSSNAEIDGVHDTVTLSTDITVLLHVKIQHQWFNYWQ